MFCAGVQAWEAGGGGGGGVRGGRACLRALLSHAVSLARNAASRSKLLLLLVEHAWFNSALLLPDKAAWRCPLSNMYCCVAGCRYCEAAGKPAGKQQGSTARGGCSSDSGSRGQQMSGFLLMHVHRCLCMFVTWLEVVKPVLHL